MSVFLFLLLNSIFFFFTLWTDCIVYTIIPLAFLKVCILAWYGANTCKTSMGV